MKIIDIDLKENGKKYFCKDINEVFEVEEGNLIPATRNFSMAELLEMEFEEIKAAKNPYERVNNGEEYYFVRGQGKIGCFGYLNCDIDNKQFNGLNYFNNRNYAEYIAFKETLMRKLDRFAWENNAKVMNWDKNVSNYCIIFDNQNKNVEIMVAYAYQSNDIYFTSKDIAEKALEEFKEDLMKLYTWRFDV